MSGYVIRQLKGDDLAVAMVIEQEELGDDRGTEQVIIPESTQTGKLLWRWAQRERRAFLFSPAAFGQPAGIKALRMEALTKAAQELKAYPIPQDHCIVSINGTAVILANNDLHVPSG